MKWVLRRCNLINVASRVVENLLRWLVPPKQSLADVILGTWESSGPATSE